MYRSGRNEADSKSVDGSNRPGVRIPPSPPNKKSRRQAGFFICIGFEVYPRKGKSLHLRQKALEIQRFQGFSFFLNGSGICLILKMVPMVPGFVVPRQFGLCTKMNVVVPELCRLHLRHLIKVSINIRTLSTICESAPVLILC